MTKNQAGDGYREIREVNAKEQVEATTGLGAPLCVAFLKAPWRSSRTGQPFVTGKTWADVQEGLLHITEHPTGHRTADFQYDVDHHDEEAMYEDCSLALHDIANDDALVFINETDDDGRHNYCYPCKVAVETYETGADVPSAVTSENSMLQITLRWNLLAWYAEENVAVYEIEDVEEWPEGAEL